MAYRKVNLNAVTSDTDGETVNTSRHEATSVFVDVPINTGAVTVKIQASDDDNDGSWYNLDSKTYTATTGSDIFQYNGHFPNMRTATTIQSDSTVTTIITGREVK